MANPNTLYTPETLASTMLALVEGDLGIARTVSRSFEGLFRGKVGYSVNIERPAVTASRKRSLPAGQYGGTALQVDTLAQDVVSITLTDEIYNAIELSDAELTLEIEDFAAEVTKPQTDAVVHGVEAEVVAKVNAVTPTLDVDLADRASVIGVFSSARATFRKNDVPMGTLWAACGVDAYGALLDLDLVKADGSAGTETEAPQIRGFRAFEHNGMDDDRIAFYHPAAFHLAMRAPVVPPSINFGVSAADRGVAFRLMRDYDKDLTAERQILQTYIGVDDLGVVRQSTGSVYVPAIAADPAVA